MEKLTPGTLLLAMFLISCVGTKKFKLLESQKAEAEKTLTGQIENLTRENEDLARKADQLTAETIKQNTMLTGLLADKINLQNEIAELETRVSQLTDLSQTTMDDLTRQLQEKNESLEHKENILNKLVALYHRQDNLLKQISTELSEKFGTYQQDEVEWYLSGLTLSVIFYRKFVYEGTQFRGRCRQALDQLSASLSDYPSLEIAVVGHAGNDPDDDNAIGRSLADARIVAEYLLDAGGINTNQLTIAGKGRFAPRVSNQTVAGREMNNRIEVVIEASQQESLELIKQQQ